MGFMEALHAVIGQGEGGGDISWWQMSVRGVLIFFYGLLLVRLAHKRIFGKWSALDIVVSIIIGSNLSRAITGTAPFVETLVATTAIVALHSLLADAASRWEPLGPVLKGKPACLITDGVVDHKELRRHAIGDGDLIEALRRDGVDDVAKVRSAYLERNGEISVIPR